MKIISESIVKSNTGRTFIVKKGQIIGYVGATGRATGSHLHYEILANGQLLDPLKLLTEPARRR